MTKRGRLWSLLVVSLTIVGVLGYVLVQRDAEITSEPVGSTTVVTPQETVLEPVPLAEAPGADRSTVAPAIDTATAASPSATPAAKAVASISGTVRFADGTIPPPFRISFDADELGPKRSMRTVEAGAERCTNKGAATIDAAGRFEVDGLCAGMYRARVNAYGSSSFFAERIEAPARDVQLVYPGRVLLVDVVGQDGQPIQGATVRAEYVPDASVESPKPVTTQLARTTDETGRASFSDESAGRYTIDAFSGALVAERVVLEHRGPSLETVKLVLAPPSTRTELRIMVSACPPMGGPVADYCLNFDDAATGLHIMRVCSEDVGADGTIDTLRAGTYRVRAVARYVGEPILYRDQAKDAGTKILVEEGRINELTLCVHLGGRIALEVRERTPVDGASTLNAFVSRVDENGGATRAFSLREPDPTGVTISHILPFGVERLSEAVLDEGEFVLRVTAKGFVDQDLRVFVRVGETTRVVAWLDRVR